MTTLLGGTTLRSLIPPLASPRPAAAHQLSHDAALVLLGASDSCHSSGKSGFCESVGTEGFPVRIGDSESVDAVIGRILKEADSS